MKKQIALLPGDGIGPEITSQAVKVLNSVAQRFKHDFRYHRALAGASAIEDSGDPMPQKTLEVCLNADAILFGAIGDPKYDNDPSAKIRPEQGLLKIREVLGLYCNIRPIKSYNALLGHSPLRKENIKGGKFCYLSQTYRGNFILEKKPAHTTGLTINAGILPTK